MAHHAPQANHETAAMTRRVLLVILVLVLAGAAAGTVLGVSLVKGFGFLDLGSFGTTYNGG